MPPPTNRLAFETSPYLLQHQHNPVDWFPWGHEAFTAAKTQNKPIFLSVGYSTCYWCHVMERQCFENPAIAAEMNRLFINIKVDREERPDVDQLYMTAVQVLTHQGGWPMSVFLTPDLRPFYGGTYFPPADTHGRPGFPTLLRALSDAFHNRKTDVEKSATQLLDILQQLAQPRLPGKNLQLDEPLLNTLITRSTADYDPANGGFGSAPKFPRQTLIELLLIRQRHHPDPQILSMLTHTLTALAHGGIHDHLGGAFHRYSTDAHWLVPHFEIMLYDNAMLAWCYAEAFSQTADPRFAAIARDICDFVLREMTDPSGAFYTAFDAEVDAREGLTYLWTDDQIRTTLSATFTSQQIDRFCDIYGLSAGPNFADPHHNSGAPDQNILFLDPDSPPDPNSPLLDPDLAAMRHTLYTARRQRKQPLLDTKIITSWNALMIRALAHAGQILEEPNYLQAAAKSANFLLAHHRTPEGSLRRTSRNGTVKHPAFLDDHAFLTDALLSLHTATNQPLWKQHAESLAEKMIENFSDPNANGFFFTPASATDLIVRQKVATDSPLPSGNAVAASALLSLGHTDVAEQILSAFAQQLADNGEGMSAMLIALDQYLQTNPPLLVAPSTPIKNQPTSLSTQSKETVKITTTWKDLKTLHVKLTTAPGYHINANPAPKGLIATQLTVPAATVDYPPPEKNSPIYHSPTLTAHFEHPPTTTIKISLTYQPCNDSACLPPVTQTLEITPMQ